MKRNLIALAAFMVAASLGPVRARTKDVAFTYRMGAGFPGDINRTHPFSALAGLMNTTNPVRLYGDPVLIDTATSSYRAFLATDTAVTKMAGLLVRPFPTQQTSGGMSSALGAATPPTSGVVDVLDEGFMMVRCNNFAANPPTKGAPVHVWITANSGVHVQGGLESINNGVNTVPISNARWMSPPDSNGIAEIQVMALA